MISSHFKRTSVMSSIKKRIITFVAFIATAAAITYTVFSLKRYFERQENSKNAMDITDKGNGTTSGYANIRWVDVLCKEGDSTSSDEDVQKNFEQANAILGRSNCEFELKLGKREYIYDSSICELSIEDVQDESKLMSLLGGSQTPSSINTEYSATVAVLKIENPIGAGARTKGFSRVGSHMLFLDNSEISKPTYTLLHELGHAWSLTHPFSLNGDVIGDIPPACASSNERVYQLEKCPQSLRTCPGATRDEMLNNVMDYLPEFCGQKYYMTPYQIDVITKSVSINLKRK